MLLVLASSAAIYEVMNVTIGNSAFCLALYLTGVHFGGELQHVGHVGERKIKCRLIITREIGGVRLQEELYVKLKPKLLWYSLKSVSFFKKVTKLGQV